MKFLFFIFCYSYSLLSSAQTWTNRHSPEIPDTVNLFFIGDVMQHAPQIKGAWDSCRQEYNYIPCFQYIQPYWQQADYVIANLETTLGNENFSGYPQFCAPWQLARDLQACGVDFLTTNNNHTCDRGARGISNTLYYLDSLQLAHTGTFTDTASWISQTPFFLRHGKFKMALLSYTYGTNGLPAGKGQVVSLIDTFHMARQIEKARLDTATHIIAIVHWGEEYHTAPNEEQKRLAQWLHEKGADIVIGSHPHVVQPLEYTLSGEDTTGVTVYSLGNFVSNQSKRYTNGGIGVWLTLIRDKNRNRYQMKYLSNYVYRPLEKGIRRYYVIPEPLAPVLLRQQDSLLYRQFYTDTDSILRGAAGKITEPLFCPPPASFL